jgi:uncharacterized repeat protein (TIGR02543 family)
MTGITISGIYTTQYIESAEYKENGLYTPSYTVYAKLIPGLSPVFQLAVGFSGGTVINLNELSLVTGEEYDIYFFYNRNRNALKFNPLADGATITPNPGLVYGSVMFDECLDPYIPTAIPTRFENGKDYTFDGWYYDLEYREAYEAGDRMPDNELMLFAKWRLTNLVKVNLYENLSMDLEKGTLLVEPGDYLNPQMLPYQTGVSYQRGVFTGWHVYTTPSTHIPFDFDTPITTTTSLHATWQASNPLGYIITVIAGPGGTASGGGVYNLGATVALNAAANDGYSFDGWYEYNARVSTNAVYSFTANANRTLEARFTLIIPNVPVFTDRDGNTLKQLTADALLTTLAYKNTTEETKSLILIVAVYDPISNLVYYATETKNFDAGQTNDFSVLINMPENTNGEFASKGYYVDVFLWEIITFIPVIDAYRFPG